MATEAHEFGRSLIIYPPKRGAQKRSPIFLWDTLLTKEMVLQPDLYRQQKVSSKAADSEVEDLDTGKKNHSQEIARRKKMPEQVSRTEVQSKGRVEIDIIIFKGF